MDMEERKILILWQQLSGVPVVVQHPPKGTGKRICLPSRRQMNTGS